MKSRFHGGHSGVGNGDPLDHVESRRESAEIVFRSPSHCSRAQNWEGGPLFISLRRRIFGHSKELRCGKV